MKRQILYCLLLLVNLPVLAQTPYFDSLRTEYQQQEDPEQFIRKQFYFARAMVIDYPDTSLFHADLIIASSRDLNFIKGEAFAQELRAKAYHNKSEYELAIKAHERHFEIQLEMGDTIIAAMVLQQLGQEYHDWGYSDKAMDAYFRALEIYEINESFDNVGSVYNDIGTVLMDQNRNEEALDYYRKGYEIRKIHSTEDRLYYSYSNLANVFDNLQMYDSVFYYTDLAIEVSKKYDDHISEAIQYINRGYTYRALEQYDSSEVYYLKALEILKDSPYNDYLITLYVNLATAVDFAGNHRKALSYLDQSRPNVEKTSALDLKENVAYTYATIYKNLNDYKKAYEKLQESHEYRDSLNAQVNEATIQELNVRYQTQKKETELAQKQYELERESLLKSRILFGGVVSVLLLTGVFLLLRYRSRLKRQQTEMDLKLERNEAEKLRELDRIKSNFFANISHEFRTPLTLILGPLRQMKHGTFKGNAQKYLDIMVRNGERLMNLVNQLLDLAKLESGRMKLQPEQGDIVKTVKAMAYSFESLAERQEINFEVNVPKATIITSFDKDKFEKIITNLLSNAFKFTGAGGQVSLSMELEPTGVKQGILKLEIKDTGIGIPEDQLPHIFERFFQATKSSDLQASSGVGLALVKELIDLHGGVIKVDSKEGMGTSFKVEIPLEEITLDSEAKESEKLVVVATGDNEAEQSKTGDLAPEGAPILLVVEDNEDVRTYVKEQLEPEYFVLEAENGRKGLDLALERTPDLIVSDVMMPDMDGLELCQQLKQNDKTSHIPVILLTAKAEREDKLEGLQTGADDYLIKPFDATELQIRIENLIQQRKRLQKSFGKHFSFSPGSVDVSSVDEVFLVNVKSTIEEFLDDETFSVEDLGKAVGMSRSQLHRKLKAMTGNSPNQIIRTMRLIRAKELLGKRAGNASEVAFMVGFNSLAYFSKCYRDHFGKSPSEVD